jgi:hypothetical protein
MWVGLETPLPLASETISADTPSIGGLTPLILNPPEPTTHAVVRAKAAIYATHIIMYELVPEWRRMNGPAYVQCYRFRIRIEL